MKIIKLALSNKDMDKLYDVLADTWELNDGYINDSDDVDEINNLTDTNKVINNVLKQMEDQNARS